jgi:hypothetical protein
LQQDVAAVLLKVAQEFTQGVRMKKAQPQARGVRRDAENKKANGLVALELGPASGGDAKKLVMDRGAERFSSVVSPSSSEIAPSTDAITGSAGVARSD